MSPSKASIRRRHIELSIYCCIWWILGIEQNGILKPHQIDQFSELICFYCRRRERQIETRLILLPGRGSGLWMRVSTSLSSEPLNTDFNIPPRGQWLFTRLTGFTYIIILCALARCWFDLGFSCARGFPCSSSFVSYCIINLLYGSARHLRRD